MAREAGFQVEVAATVFKPHFARFWPALNGYQTAEGIDSDPDLETLRSEPAYRALLRHEM